jgi:hypothetical protein
VRVGKVGWHLTIRFPTESNVVVCHGHAIFLTLTLENNDESGSWYAFWVVGDNTPSRTLLGSVKVVSKKVVDLGRMLFGSMFGDFIFRKRIRGGV